MALTHCTMTPSEFWPKTEQDSGTGCFWKTSMKEDPFSPSSSSCRSGLEMWEVCLPEPNAEPLKKGPKLAKKKRKEKKKGQHSFQMYE